MRIRRRWVIGSLVGAGALGALAVGVAVASPLGDGEKPRDKVIERAEAILGLESGRLEDALQQAHADIAKDRRNEHFDQLVKDGVITQAEADEIKAWLDSMPESVHKLPGKFGLLPGAVPVPREFRGEFGVPRHPRFGPGSPHGLPFEWKLPPDWKPTPAPTPASGT